MNLRLSLSIVFSIAWLAGAHGQKAQSYDLKSLLSKNLLTVHNRNLSVAEKGISVDAKDGDGVVWLNDVSFSNGSIEFDVKGQNVPQQSFVGVAFHGVDTATHEVIYFRPFNFLNPERKTRSVQYAAHPDYPWHVLREKFPGKYESAIESPPDPTGWFHVKVDVSNSTIKVFVNGSQQPSLTVESIVKLSGTKIGLWVGNSSPGDFANLTITSR